MPPLCLFDKHADAVAKIWNRQRLGDVVACAFSDGLDRRVGRIVAGDKNDLGFGSYRYNLFQQFHSADTGHEQVEKNDLGPPFANDVQSGLRIGSGQDPQVRLFERVRNQVETSRVVINHQKSNAGFVCSRHILDPSYLMIKPSVSRSVYAVQPAAPAS